MEFAASYSAFKACAFGAIGDGEAALHVHAGLATYLLFQITMGTRRGGLATLMVLALGLAVASLSAFGAIWGLMRVLERFSSWPFVAYRAGLGILLLFVTARIMVV